MPITSLPYFEIDYPSDAIGFSDLLAADIRYSLRDIVEKLDLNCIEMWRLQ